MPPVRTRVTRGDGGAADEGIDRGIDAAVQTFRLAAWVWLAAVTALSYASVARPVAALAGVVAAGLVTAWAQGHDDRWLLAVELAVGGALVASDGWVFDDGRAQSFGGVWPLAGVFAIAARTNGATAAVAGLGLGAARTFGEVAFVRGEWSATRLLGVASTGVLFALAGWAAGWAADRIRSAERTAARAEARAEVAAELHDGVLQTLAVIQRRSDDGDLVRLARSQEAELRSFLADDAAEPGGPVPVEALLRAVAAEATTRHGMRVDLALVPPLPSLPGEAASLVRGAVAECLANTAKHSGVDRAAIFAEHEAGRLVVDVHDDGAGFDPAGVTRRGLESSVERRIARLGGSTALDARPGGGTRVSFEIPTGRIADVRRRA